VKIAPASGARWWSAPLAPFAVRSFRFQWPADLLVAWAFEMETLILGWYVLVGTQSVFYLTLFGALQFTGTLLAPFSGVAGDRLGRRTTLCTMRFFMGLIAAAVMVLALADMLEPTYVLPFAFLTGLVRPSDMVMRNSPIGPGSTVFLGPLVDVSGQKRPAAKPTDHTGSSATAWPTGPIGTNPTKSARSLWTAWKE